MATHFFVSTFQLCHLSQKNIFTIMKKQFKSTYPLNLTITNKDGKPLDYCGIRCSLEVLGGKWKLLILSQLFDKKLRFSEIKKNTPGISDKMLVSSLQELEYHNLVVREVVKAKPKVVEYSLSTYGEKVRPVLEVLFQWGENHITQHQELIFFS